MACPIDILVILETLEHDFALDVNISFILRCPHEQLICWVQIIRSRLAFLPPLLSVILCGNHTVSRGRSNGVWSLRPDNGTLAAGTKCLSRGCRHGR